ncbi:MAG TPA: hypothetical protein VIV60_15185 [Polyangiaceae bacterium]
MTHGVSNKLLTLLVLALSISGCGGSESKPAQSVAEAAPDSAPSAPKATKPIGPDCSDGTCIVCGSAQCPKGFFCDESNPKATCQWVPSCTDSVNCACVARSIGSGCQCTERDGAAYVRCSD